MSTIETSPQFEWVVTMNGRTHIQMAGVFRDTNIRQFLSRLNGDTRYSMILWHGSEGQTFNDLDFVDGPEEYIQAAGSAERMTVEVRAAQAGGYRQSVVGRKLAEDLPIDQTIRWDDYEVRVSTDELFDAAEAGDLFVFYCNHQAIPEDYALRELAI